jgi:hypothetical protein
MSKHSTPKRHGTRRRRDNVKQRRRGIMRELNLVPYLMKLTRIEVKEGVRVETLVDEPYPLRLSLCNILFGEEKVGAREAIARDRLCQLIEEAGDSVLLEEADWKRLEQACLGLSRVGRFDVPLVQRVLDAPEVKVEKISDDTVK